MFSPRSIFLSTCVNNSVSNWNNKIIIRHRVMDFIFHNYIKHVMPVHTMSPHHNKTLNSQYRHQEPTRPLSTMHAVSHLPATVYTETHLWKEHFSKEPVSDTITEEVSICAFKVSYDDKLPSGQDPQWGEWANRQNSLKWFLVEASIASAVHMVSDCHMCKGASWVTGDA